MSDYPKDLEKIKQAVKLVRSQKGVQKPEALLREKIQPILDNRLTELGIDVANIKLVEANPSRIFYDVISTDKKRYADIVYGRVFLEYEAPGVLSSNQGRTHAEEQIKEQIDLAVRENKNLKDKILGIVFDGEHFAFIKFITFQNDYKTSVYYDLNENTYRLFTESFFGLDKKPFTASTINEICGQGSDFSERFVNKAIKQINKSLGTNDRADTFFNTWHKIFGIIYGETAGKKEVNDIEIIRKIYNIDKNIENFEVCLFAIHTYFAFVSKIIATSIIRFTKHSDLSPNDLSELLLGSNDINQFKTILEVKLEKGEIFAQIGIKNFLSGDLFSWYVDYIDNDWRNIINPFLREFQKLSPLSLLDNEQSADILKILYQSVIPKSVRHDLGEYYTPDWLASFVVDESPIGKNKKLYKVLDPACGSGTFIIEIIKRYISILKNENEDNIINKISQNVYGFDVNPLAIIATKTNYILSLGELLISEDYDSLEIPIYECDSILTLFDHTEKKSGAGGYKLYIFPEVGPEFIIPEKYLDSFSNIIDSIDKSITKGKSFNEWLAKQEMKLTSSETDLFKNIYFSFKKLFDEGKNGIWANIVKNSVAPLIHRPFDIVLGNPPWVNWESLSESYRKKTDRLWQEQEYNIFSKKSGWAARSGAAKDDISILLVYVCIDRYLKDNGILGFVLKQSLFKSTDGGAGFRNFQIKGKTFSVEEVHDLSYIKPFEHGVPTAVFFAKKATPQKQYPVKYIVWEKQKKFTFRESHNHNDVKNKYSKKELYAEPIREINSSWIHGTKNEISAFKKLVGESPYQAREGVNTGGANQIYWVKIKKEGPNKTILVENYEKKSRWKEFIKSKDLEQFYLERNMVFPFLEGKDIDKWHITLDNSKGIIIPQDPKDWKKPLLNLPNNTHKYFEKFKEKLLERPYYKQYLKNKPPYAMYNIGDYTFAKYKVVWSHAKGDMKAAVLDEKIKHPFLENPIIPDQNIVFVGCNSSQEAYFVAALLNSKLISGLLKNYSQLSYTTHIFDHVNIPKFDLKSEQHKKIAILAQLVSKDDEMVSKLERNIETLFVK